ncbi:bifunctional adenosylcobinamide kinase/adenosylcobinamide-phosphate guanylyltransferase [Acidisphaera rubrifaciens]|uniref:Bifunctional adenosylcobalamin biosynthesis protein n=1 Tax=Acidisphaera rubrifaciens HS-AP3 TaxID=1231350 RepID=A0A0D6P591_9PROT|nr:bifunctional adenosylcobinamide kinase/adenosylcobinamide-phosphate guanylyltransferase [Acidisphaera rubrifaciens]GAN76822.1 adenosylcobalamin biosynthesis bifunctional protein CobP [Acidisphaera rubrifaciens HS-AP3]
MSPPQVNHVTLVLGGARSGKSRHAESLLTAGPPPWCYVATAQAFDAEMADRIAIHRARRTEGWRTFEAPLDIDRALARAAGLPVLIDCLTLWVSNLLLGERDIDAAGAALLAAIDRHAAPIVLVANETGLGIVPDSALARRFRDAAGWLNQRVAVRADRVLFMVAGLPMVVK